VLVGAVALLLLMRAPLGRSIHRREVSLGLERRNVIAADDSPIGTPTLRSARFGLVGRPNHLVRSNGVIIPVEQKPHAQVCTIRTCFRLQPSVYLFKRSQGDARLMEWWCWPTDGKRESRLLQSWNSVFLRP
jgi:hypothetical protein